MNKKDNTMMRRLAIASAMTLFTALAGSGEAAPAKGTKTVAKPESCESVSALAAGFGKENVTGFANGNLDLAIDQAKNRLADKGVKGFSVRKRNVACENYIDFGGTLGREHKCTASAQLCGGS